MLLYILYLLSYLSTLYQASLVLDLGSSATWSVTGGNNITVPASVPGGVYTDLRQAGVLAQDIYYRFNDLEYRWVAKEDWTYRGVFTVDKLLLEESMIELDCHGLDTVANVVLNGVEIGGSNNMFVRYIWDVKNAVVEGENILEIYFQSPITYSQQQFELQVAEHHLVPPVCQPDVFQGECHANHIRKMQASFSWDWGPAFPNSGIWLPINLVFFDHPRIKYILWEVKDSMEDSYEVKISAIMNGPKGPLPYVMGFSLDGALEEQLDEVTLETDENDEIIWSVTTAIAKSEVETWWPNGRGSQTLYDLHVSVYLPGEEGAGPLDKMTKKVAFRTVELVQEPLEQGLSFYFRVNSEAIFMKGSNWIPAHVLPEQVSSEYMSELLYSAKEANMNMLRVWGGGIYELEEFYDLADQMGILIWQDFMFACSMYPADDATLQTVTAEVKHQVRRLQHHASLALWAANNENEAALRGNWYNTDADFEVYKEDYIKLYVGVVKEVARSEDPSRNFVVSSPSNGDASEEEGYIANNPYSPLYGDTHYYNYKENNWDWTTYPKTRFASEYGFQSFPSFEILEPVSEIWDWSFSSAWMSHRQHHPGGNLELQWQISLNMDLDMDTLENTEGWQEFLYLAHVYQAVSLKTETETYRRGMSMPDPVTGEGMTMGALYWQLNDIWQGASWASMEFGGKWKMSHYYAEKFFKPILISPIIEGEDVNVYGVCDHKEHNMMLDIKIYHWDSFSPTYNTSLSLGPGCVRPGSVILYSTPLADLMSAGSCHPGSYDGERLGYCLITFTLVSETNTLLSENYLMDTPR